MAHVLGEVFDDVIGCFEDRNVVTLDMGLLGQAGVIHAGNDGGDLRDPRGEAGFQLSFADAAAGIKPFIAVADVVGAAHGADDPLPGVSDQMENQIADCVFVLAGASPYLILPARAHI